MPNYFTKKALWLSHECRSIPENSAFTTTFPKVKVDGKEVDMKLGEGIELVKEDEKPVGKGGKGGGNADLAG